MNPRSPAPHIGGSYKNPTLPPATAGDQLPVALAKIRELIVEGCTHGFFEITISGEMIQGRKRQVLIKAGRSYKFTIPAEELDR